MQTIASLALGSNIDWFGSTNQIGYDSIFDFATHLQQLQASVKSAVVGSVSYGTNEATVSPYLLKSLTTETMQAGAQGVFVRPAYQKTAVTSYLSWLPSSTIAPSSSSYNSGGRGYPDISAMGHDYLVLDAGSLFAVDGTSASGPAIASMIAKLNARRNFSGIVALGFINPWIYNLTSECFSDITARDNRCGTNSQSCCATGFEATSGWDAATGLGSPVFQCWLSAALSMPFIPNSDHNPEPVHPSRNIFHVHDSVDLDELDPI